jgi:uncharacterized protein DUF5681
VSKKPQSKRKANPGWFPKGRSGNPKGRPTCSRAPRVSAFEVMVDKTLTVTHHGGTREITMQEALQQRTYQDALAGKRMAMREVVKWLIKREAWLAEHAAKASDLAIKYSYDSDNADAALQLLGIAAPDPDRAGWDKDRAQLLLEPWAVQAALRRRRGGHRLTDNQREEIRRCTRDPDSLRWPRRTKE